MCTYSTYKLHEKFHYATLQLLTLPLNNLFALPFFHDKHEEIHYGLFWLHAVTQFQRSGTVAVNRYKINTPSFLHTLTRLIQYSMYGGPSQKCIQYVVVWDIFWSCTWEFYKTVHSFGSVACCATLPVLLKMARLVSPSCYATYCTVCVHIHLQMGFKMCRCCIDTL